MKAFKKIFSLFLRLSISVILLIFLFRQVDKKSLLEIVKNADWMLLIIAFFIALSPYILCIFRWEMLLKKAKIHLPLTRVIISMSGGMFFNLFLPSTIGGDVVRSIDLSAHTQKPREVVATVFLDRLSGYVGLVIVALIAVSCGWKLIDQKVVLIPLAIITVILLAILLVLFNKSVYARINALLQSPSSGKLREYIKDLHQEIHVFRQYKKVIVKNLLLSILIQMISPIGFYITALSIGVKINIMYFFMFLPIIGAITLLPISIGGLGLREYLSTVFFKQAGVNAHLAFTMSLINSVFILMIGGIGGLIYVFTVHHRRIQRHPSSCVHQAPS